MRAPARNEELSRLEAALADGIGCMVSLKSLLVQERSALEERDPERLAVTAQQKQNLVSKLAGFSELNRAIGNIATVPERATDRWREFQSIARECDQLNKTNGTIIRSRHQQVLAGLSLLRGNDRSSETYSPSGGAATAIGGRALAEA